MHRTCRYALQVETLATSLQCDPENGDGSKLLFQYFERRLYAHGEDFDISNYLD